MTINRILGPWRPSTIRLYFLLAIASTCFVLVTGTGCGAGYYADKVKRNSRCAYFVHKLGDYPQNKKATERLIEALDNKYPAGRYFAAEALQKHLQVCERPLRIRALHALVGVLGDNSIGRTSWPTYGPLLPGTSGFTGSVRSRALLTMTFTTNEDLGFDQSAWAKLIDTRYAEEQKGEDEKQ